ncbi:hypothetical protein RV08_GL002274 [Enterococcus mundtii]|nr:hypothetical protein [Enterococcus mundtii 3F]OJG62615.1 hypothetical protein RV08_GL002274 [Enterococcus mundtii]
MKRNPSSNIEKELGKTNRFSQVLFYILTSLVGQGSLQFG